MGDVMETSTRAPLAELIPSETGHPYIGKCPAKGCRHAVRILTEPVSVGVDRFGNSRTAAGVRHTWRRAADYVRADGTGPKDWNTFSPIVEVFEWEIFEDISSLGKAAELGILPRCPVHDRQLRFNRVEGRLVESVPCDRRCTGARGHNCDCSCGGKNHGADWQTL